MEQKTFIRIPSDRIGVLIGADGKTRRRIESAFGVKITIESESGSVEVKVNQDQRDVSVERLYAGEGCLSDTGVGAGEG